jgi:cupin superfamily acireductone dioxygenase involved in methionine salvage
MKKNYEQYDVIDIKLIPSTKNENSILVKDVVSGLIVTSKHVNYINAIDMDLYTIYKVEVARYTNERGYKEFDFVKVLSYVPQENTKKVSPVKKTPQAASSKQNKPSWLK